MLFLMDRWTVTFYRGNANFRWDNGFILDKENYHEKRVQLQQQLEKLTPIPEDELSKAVDILEDFTTHWEKQVMNAKHRKN